MRFSRAFGIAFGIAGLLSGCGGGDFEEDDDAESEFSINFYNEASPSVLKQGEQFLFVDTNLGHLIDIQADPLTYNGSKGLGFDRAEQWVMTATNGNYFVSAIDGEYAIVNDIGVIDKNPLEMDDEIIGMGFDADNHYLFIEDELKKIGSVKLDENGNVVSSFVGEQNFGLSEAFVKATILDTGKIVASLGESTLAVVDLAASHKNEKWSVSTFTVDGASSMSWLAEVPDEDNQVVIKDSERIILVDISTEKTLDEVDLAAKSEIKASREGYPHVMAADNLTDDNAETEPYTVYYAKDDALVSVVVSSVRRDYTRSFLDVTNDRLIVAKNNLSSSDDDDEDEDKNYYLFAGDIYRYKLSEGSSLDKSTINDEVRLGISSTYLMLQYNSALGYLKRREYGDNADQEVISKFNLDILREKYD